MVACAKCGARNPEGARFCHACGASLAEAPGAPRATRKTVTVLFCDVVDSTGRGERIDPESVRRVMSRYFEEMRAALEAHGGTVEKFIGDAVMAVFGVPTAHEDDALRAVRAAAEMQSRLARLNEELTEAWGVRLAIRIGINTGEVVAGDPRTRQTIVDAERGEQFDQAAQPDASPMRCDRIAKNRNAQRFRTRRIFLQKTLDPTAQLRTLCRHLTRSSCIGSDE